MFIFAHTKTNAHRQTEAAYNGSQVSTERQDLKLQIEVSPSAHGSRCQMWCAGEKYGRCILFNWISEGRHKEAGAITAHYCLQCTHNVALFGRTTAYASQCHKHSNRLSSILSVLICSAAFCCRLQPVTTWWPDIYFGL